MITEISCTLMELIVWRASSYQIIRMHAGVQIFECVHLCTLCVSAASGVKCCKCCLLGVIQATPM